MDMARVAPTRIAIAFAGRHATRDMRTTSGEAGAMLATHCWVLGRKKTISKPVAMHAANSSVGSPVRGVNPEKTIALLPASEASRGSNVEANEMPLTPTIPDSIRIVHSRSDARNGIQAITTTEKVKQMLSSL